VGETGRERERERERAPIFNPKKRARRRKFLFLKINEATFNREKRMNISFFSSFQNSHFRRLKKRRKNLFLCFPLIKVENLSLSGSKKITKAPKKADISYIVERNKKISLRRWKANKKNLHRYLSPLFWPLVTFVCQRDVNNAH